MVERGDFILNNRLRRSSEHVKQAVVLQIWPHSLSVI